MTNQQPEVARSATSVRAASLLRMANRWQALGQINQARDAYLQLLRLHPSGPEANEAAEKLFAQALEHERQGQFRLALSLYEKLESRL